MAKSKNTPNLEGMLRSQLMKLATSLGIRGSNRYSKPELVKLITEARARGVEPTGKPKRSRRKASKAASTQRHVSPKAVPTDSNHRPLTSSTLVSQPPVALSAPEAAYVDRGAALPRHYGRDTLVGMVRDPNWVYVYWELEGDRKQQIAREYGSEIFFHSRWVLRLHNLTSCVEEDIPVLIESGNWYLSVPDSSEFFVELGLLTADHTFIRLASSNTFQTPRSNVCTDEDEQWMVVEEDFQKLVEMCGGHFERLMGSRVAGEGRQAIGRISGMHSVAMGSGSVRRNGSKK